MTSTGDSLSGSTRCGHLGGRGECRLESDDIGLYYYGARYYNPTTGGFATGQNHRHYEDSMSLNRYIFARDNPEKTVDPNGHLCALPSTMIDGATSRT